MSGRSLLWRAIIWVERFLPTPPTLPEAGHSDRRRRKAALIPLLILPGMMPALVRGRQGLAGIMAQNRPLFERLGLVAACCAILATIGFGVSFGVQAWRDAKAFR